METINGNTSKEREEINGTMTPITSGLGGSVVERSFVAPTSLGSLSDVEFLNVKQDDVLSYNGTKWVNKENVTPPTDLASLTDVTLAEPNEGEVLMYTGETWENRKITETTWNNLDGKPFESVGNDFAVSSNELQIKKAIKDDIDKIPSLVNKTSHLDNGGTINADYVLYDGGNVKDELDGVIDVVGTDRKNLIPYPYASTEDYGKDFTRYGIHYITDDNGIIKASGTVTSSAGIFLELISRDEDRALLLPKGKYRLSGMKINSSTSQTSPSLQVRNIVTPSITYASDRGGGAEFTLEENTKIRLGIAGSNGITFDVVVAPMIVKVSEDGTYPTEYIPYMPNGIVGKVNELTAKLSMLEDNNAGVNLIDINKLEQGIFDTQGVDYPSTEASYNKTVRFKGIYTVKPNTTYTINAQSNKNVQVYVLYFSATVGTWGTGWKTFPFTFTPDASTSEIRIGFRVPDGDTLSPSDFSNIQIQLGNEATKYEQYNGLSNAQLSEATENITKELKENKKLNGLFVEYNANTDRTVEANRIAAIKYLIENYGSCIAAVRYSGGYYHQVIITKFNRDFFITEHTHTTKQIVYWQSNGTTTTKLYTITGV